MVQALSVWVGRAGIGSDNVLVFSAAWIVLYVTSRHHDERESQEITHSLAEELATVLPEQHRGYVEEGKEGCQIAHLLVLEREQAAEQVEREFVSSDRIFSAIDYLTKCGVGICGACHCPDGRRICVDGPFIATQGD